MAAAEHDHHDLTPPKKFELGKNFYVVALALIAIGTLAFVGGLLGGLAFGRGRAISSGFGSS